jgi:ribosomal protein S18 acetylase RimI-like enzyme
MLSCCRYWPAVGGLFASGSSSGDLRAAIPLRRIAKRSLAMIAACSLAITGGYPCTRPRSGRFDRSRDSRGARDLAGDSERRLRESARSAFIDDLYVRPMLRNRGAGKALLERARAACQVLGIRAIHVEVSRTNGPAQAIYRGAGFESTDRELLTVALADPTHAA